VGKSIFFRFLLRPSLYTLPPPLFFCDLLRELFAKPSEIQERAFAFFLRGPGVGAGYRAKEKLRRKRAEKRKEKM